jgi:pre-rRNA-processing protein IPI3
LPSSAVSLALDPVDRAFYVGYEDGSVQSVDLYKTQSIQHPLHDPSLQSTPSQPSVEEKWSPPSADCGAAQSLSLSYDGMTLLSGHQIGKVFSWNVGRRKYASTIADYTHPVTNLLMLPPNGLPQPTLGLRRVAHTIVKPRYDSTLSESSQAAGAVPADYTFSTHLITSTSSKLATVDGSERTNQFTEAFAHPFFPDSMLEEGLAELAALDQPGGNTAQATPMMTMAQATNDSDLAAKEAHIANLENEIAALKKKATVNEAARQLTTDEVTTLRSNLVNLQDYINDLHQKQDEAQQEKVLRQARKEERETRKREAWFAAEKKGKKGDAILRKMEIEDSAHTSGSDDQSSDE